MNVYGLIAIKILAVFFCWAAWAGWNRSMWFSSWFGAMFACVGVGFGLTYFLRAAWDVTKILWGKG